MLYVNCVELRVYHERVWCMVSLSVANEFLDRWARKIICMQNSDNIFEKPFSTVKNQFLYMHLHALSASHSVIVYGRGEIFVCLCEGMPSF